MAGSICKAHGRQHQKRKAKGGPKYGITVSRMKAIPFICPECRTEKLFNQFQAYKPGGNACRRCSRPPQNDSEGNPIPNTGSEVKYRFNTAAKDFGPTRTLATKK